MAKTQCDSNLAVRLSCNPSYITRACTTTPHAHDPIRCMPYALLRMTYNAVGDVGLPKNKYDFSRAAAEALADLSATSQELNEGVQMNWPPSNTACRRAGTAVLKQCAGFKPHGSRLQGAAHPMCGGWVQSTSGAACCLLSCSSTALTSTWYTAVAMQVLVMTAACPVKDVPAQTATAASGLAVVQRL
jgi:hypothetical protein